MEFFASRKLLIPDLNCIQNIIDCGPGLGHWKS